MKHFVMWLQTVAQGPARGRTRARLWIRFSIGETIYGVKNMVRLWARGTFHYSKVCNSAGAGMGAGTGMGMGTGITIHFLTSHSIFYGVGAG